MSTRIDLTGRRFGRLTVTGIDHRDDRGRLFWAAVCDCGKTTVCNGELFRNGKTRSCGCLRSETCATLSRTHGQSATPEYGIWTRMVQRCHNPAAHQYHDYGGRGITVCVQWRESFETFIAEVGPRPTPKHTIDRIDNDRGYEPGNVQWSTRIAQANNKRNNRLVEFHGRSQTIPAWSRETGLRAGLIFERLRDGWPVEKALTTPARPMRRSTQ